MVTFGVKRLVAGNFLSVTVLLKTGSFHTLLVADPTILLLLLYPTCILYKNQITMSYSPIQQTLHPVYQDLDVPRQDLRYYRATSDENETVNSVELLDLGDSLLKQCGFLDTKLNKKVRVYLSQR